MMTQRTKTTAAVVLFLVAFWLWVSELPLTPLADARPVPDADDERKVVHAQFGGSERKERVG